MSTSPLSRRIPHLPALDGLRGLGLVGVLLFHADGLLPGGYLGVDLFFVLSGYLITSLLLAEQRATGRIDLVAFWIRRCRRLFPALLAMMPAIAIYGRFYARPDELATLRSEALATLSYVANWRAILDHRSYWQLFAQPSPLEHTWSLSIEEQFYVIWPLLVLFLLRRFGERSVLWTSLLLGVASMGAMLLVFSPEDSSRAYLGTDTRMAGILAGAVLATLLRPGARISAPFTRWFDVLGGVAAVGLGLAVWKLGGTDPFLYRGGFWLCELAVLALIACAVLDRASLFGRVLAFRPLAWLGTVSYGVYLWHWPVHVFVTEARVHLHGLELGLLRLCITLAIALTSFYLIEQPIRRHGVPFGRPQHLVPASVVLTLLLLVRATEARGSASGAPQTLRPPTSPPVVNEAAEFRVLLFGDSTANSLGWGLLGMYEPGVEVHLLGKDGCNLLRADSCNGSGADWAGKVRDMKADVAIVHVGGAFLHGLSIKGRWRTACNADWDQKLEQNLSSHLVGLATAGKPIFLATAPYPLGHWENAERRKEIDCVNQVVRKAAASAPGVRVLEIGERVCPKGICQRELESGELLRTDGIHFTMNGAIHVARGIYPELRRPATF